MLKKGDPCYVRNHYGEIEECRYSHANGKSHTVHDQSGGVIKVGKYKPDNVWSGRFVCMTGIRGKNENQKDQ